MPTEQGACLDQLDSPAQREQGAYLDRLDSPAQREQGAREPHDALSRYQQG